MGEYKKGECVSLYLRNYVDRFHRVVNAENIYEILRQIGWNLVRGMGP